VILADTSVWIDHFRRREPHLVALLAEEQVLGHPFVTGELALGHLQRRATILSRLAQLPQIVPAVHEEVLGFVESHALHGTGLGWVDVHLLCAVARERCRLWTFDRRLAAAAERLGLAARAAP
jgi:predicted nucleic acid-binding protein